MKKEYKIQKNETLAQYCDRMAIVCEGKNAKEIRDILHEVSVASYIKGSNTTEEIYRKFAAKP